MTGGSIATTVHKLWRAVTVWLPCVFLMAVLPACTHVFSLPDGPTALPSEYIPTVIAMTLQAARPQATATAPTAAPASTSTPTGVESTATPKPTASATPIPPRLSDTPLTPTRRVSPTRTPTPTPEPPFAEIEYRNLGPLSKVISPITVQTYFKQGASGKLRIELLGEDGRMLYRNIRPVSNAATGAWVFLVLDIEFEISAAAESGRLQLSVADEYDRIIALNSVPLILLSIGEADINPPVDALAPIVIQQPGKKALIQGGRVLVSGLVRPESDQPLMVRLLTTKGSEVGARLASITPAEGGYSTFAVEVPYNVTRPTSVILVVTMGAANINDIIHLSSREIIVGP